MVIQHVTPTGTDADERIMHFVRHSSAFRATAQDVSRWIGVGVDEAQEALDDLVARNVLRRHEIPGEDQVYWS